MLDTPKATGGKRSPDKTLLEWEFNNDMQYRLKARLEQLGFVVYLVNPNPDKGAEVSLAARCNKANDYWKKLGKPNCLFVSLHANAAGSGTWYTARGVEVFTSKAASTKSQNAAKKVCSAIYKDVYAIDKGFKNRGHKLNNFYVVKNTAMPSILIEYAFYDNKEDIKLLKNKRELLCEATLKGLCEYFGVNYKTGTAVSKPVQETVKPVQNNLPSNGKPWKNGTYNAKVKVTANSLNVRAGRPGSPEYNNIIGKLPKNTVVQVGYCLNGWFGVIVNGKQGFISGDYVTLV
jgi:hypothetical protein